MEIVKNGQIDSSFVETTIDNLEQIAKALETHRKTLKTVVSGSENILFGAVNWRTLRTVSVKLLRNWKVSRLFCRTT